MFRINTQGTAYLEYLMLALLVFMATMAFFTNHLMMTERPGARGSVRGSIEQAFSAGCEGVLDGANCQ